jgi:hypothetical protein
MFYHVLNRANARRTLFEDDEGYAAFEWVLGQACERVSMRLLAYCVMPNHWHLVVWLLRFIRLWKKLGWSIEQTDKAITALYPADQLPNDADDNVNLQRLDAGFLALLPGLALEER